MNIQDFPKRIAIEIMLDCNLSCPVCPRKFIKNKEGCMDKALWIKLLDEIKACSPDSIVLPFWRGESLLHPQFHDFMEEAFKRSLRVHISTNGIPLNDEIAKQLIKCDFVTFSVHTISGYESAKKFLKFRMGKTPLIQVSFVESEATTKKFYASIIKSSDLNGFDTVRFYAQHTKDGLFGSTDKGTTTERIFCPKLQDTLAIAYDGKISRCSHIWQTEKSINVRDMSIKEVWNSLVLRKIRENYPDRQCGPCGQWTGHTRGESWYREKEKVVHKNYNLED